MTKISTIVTVDEPVFLKPCCVPPLTNCACHAAICAGFSDALSNCMPAAVGMKRRVARALASGTLAVAGGAPTLTVNALGADAAARLAAALGGTAGLTKIGPGTLVLDRANTLTGAINVNGGTLFH